MQKKLLLLLGVLCLGITIQGSSIVFIHIGRHLPPYLYDAVSQARLFNTCPIYLLAEQRALQEQSFCHDTSLVTAVPLETLKKQTPHQLFLELTSLDKQSRDGFWFYASERFLYLNDFIQQHDIHDVIHLENDNMLYVNVDELIPLLITYYKNTLGAVFDNDNRCIPSVIYVPNKESILKLATFFAQNAQSGHHDMKILADFKNRYHRATIEHLPIVSPLYITHQILKSPCGYTTQTPELYCLHAQKFNSVFDGAAIGQYLGGQDPRNGPSLPGFINESCLFNPSHFLFKWKNDHRGRKIPYMIFKEDCYRINNLHIHSKNLKKFSSLRSD